MRVTVNYGSDNSSPQKWIPTSFDVRLIFVRATSGLLAGTRAERNYHFNNSNSEPIQVGVNTPIPGSIDDRE